MHHLHRISWIMTAIGAAATAVALLADLDEIWLLSGILLLWAGIVKVVITVIWARVANLGTDDHQPTPSP